MADRPLVFGIGLNKTATSSLHEALVVLGWRPLHWGGPDVRRRLEDALSAGGPPLAGLDEEHDAFSDVEPIYRNVARYADAFPHARFVLTVRPVDEWIDSRRRHVQKNRRRAASGAYQGTFLDIDVDAWHAEWEHHLASVDDAFAGRRERLLTMDLTDGRGWPPLCAFLDQPIPDRPFPHANAYRPSFHRPEDRA